MLDTPDLPFDDLTFVTEGEAVYQVNDTVCVLKRGDAVYLPARASRKARNSGMECFAFTSSFSQARYCRCPANYILEWGPVYSMFKEFNRAWISNNMYSRFK